MIELLFSLGPDFILVRITGNKIEFANSGVGMMMGTIENMRLDKAGVIREFPDLADNDDWHKIALQRFKEHIAILPGEDAISTYVIKELRTYGYTPLRRQIQGRRQEHLV